MSSECVRRQANVLISAMVSHGHPIFSGPCGWLALSSERGRTYHPCTRPLRNMTWYGRSSFWDGFHFSQCSPGSVGFLHSYGNTRVWSHAHPSLYALSALYRNCFKIGVHILSTLGRVYVFHQLHNFLGRHVLADTVSQARVSSLKHDGIFYLLVVECVAHYFCEESMSV